VGHVLRHAVVAAIGHAARGEVRGDRKELHVGVHLGNHRVEVPLGKRREHPPHYVEVGRGHPREYCEGAPHLTRRRATDRVAANDMPIRPPPNSELTTEIVEEPGGVRLMLRGELDMNSVLDAERAVERAAWLSGEAGTLLIDLSGLSFMDLFGARTLLRVADSTRTAGRHVAIVNPQPHLRRLFELITDLPRGRDLVSELVR